jgi:hypothetical protein
LYVRGNPTNVADPSGLFPREMISKNIPLNSFYVEAGSDNHEHLGFYALLLNAQDFNYVRIGSVNLATLHPSVSWSTTKMVWSIGCDTIMVGFQNLKQYYESEVKRKQQPLIWWRDTSPMFYDMFGVGQPLQSFADGLIFGYRSDYPEFRGFSGCSGPVLGDIEFNIIVGINGDLHFSVAGGGGGHIGGFGYTESYTCGISTCPIAPSTEEMAQAIDGLCVNAGIIVIGGINLSLLCGGLNRLNQFTISQTATYYVGLEFGGGVTGSLTLPLSLLGVPPDPSLGWKWALDDQINGITTSRIIQMGG